jgi:hypothetical protein
MSTDQAPPDFGVDDDTTTNDDSMFVSAISPTTVDISLSGADEDDDENPFEAPPTTTRIKTPTNTTNTVESSVDDENKIFQQGNLPVHVDEDDEDLFAAKNTDNNSPSVSVPAQVPIALSEPRTPVKQENQFYPTDLKSGYGETTTASKPVKTRSTENNIEITVSDPTKVGEVSLIIILIILIILYFSRVCHHI